MSKFAQILCLTFKHIKVALLHSTGSPLIFALYQLLVKHEYGDFVVWDGTSSTTKYFPQIVLAPVKVRLFFIVIIFGQLRPHYFFSLYYSINYFDYKPLFLF